MTQQYGGHYCVRLLEGEAVGSQPDPAERLDFQGDEAQLAAEGPAAIRAATVSRTEAEQLVDNPNFNYERERLILDLDPVSANLPSQATSK